MLNSLTFYFLAVWTLASAIAAMTLRNLVHCALCAASALGGVALVYLQLDAEFVGFAQVLVYVGAVAILVLFTVMLTRGADIKPGVSIASRSWIAGIVVAAFVLAAIALPILMSPSLRHEPVNPTVSLTVRTIGEALMNRYVLPLEAVGLLLTGAMLGAVVVAMQEKPANSQTTAPSPKRTEEKELAGVGSGGNH